jgi:hypothetical protein
MSAGLRALLFGILDYAGLFPPAKLPLDQALRNYARYRREADTWMLGRFVIPAARLGELAAYHEDPLRSGPTFVFTALGRSGETIQEFLAGLKSDLQDISTFRTRLGERVDMLEARLPADLADPRTPDSVQVLNQIVRYVDSAGLRLFIEASGRPGGLLEQMARLRAEPVGFKLRCGGLEASAFPSSEQIAAVLRACLDAGVPFKATAGLHHPLPRFDSALKVRMHGFVNLFLAGVLAHARNLSAEQIVQVLNDDRPEHFTFDDEGASWRNVRATTAEITAARRDAVLSFGSCSFDEPREDLLSLGWL